MRVEAFIQSVPKRQKVADRLAQQLRDSDIDDFQVLMQEPDHDPWQHFWRVFEAMKNSSAELVIRLEDDALINPHLAHNSRTWPALRKGSFGCGWLYSPPTCPADYAHKARTRQPYRDKYLEGCVAVLFKREDLGWLVDAAKTWATRNPTGYCYDLAISWAVYQKRGKHLWLHDPPIVEHDSRTTSAFGHVIRGNNCTMGAFNRRFRRR